MVRTAESLPDHGRVPVAVYHRDPLLHMGLLASLRDVRGLDVSAVDAMDGMARWSATLCDDRVAVCDYETGVALAADMGRRRGAPRVMVVTQRDGETDVQTALARGVRGYLLVGCGVQDVVDAVIALSRGRRFLSPSAAQRVADGIYYEALTPREEEVLRFLVIGWSNKRVATRMGVSEGTVKCHVKAIFGKLAVSTRTEAATVAIRRGLASPDAVAVAAVASAAEVGGHSGRAIAFHP